MADKLTVATDVVGIGPFTVPTEELVMLPAEDANKNGIVLANERRKILVKHGDKFVTYTISAYIQREPLDDAEAERVTAAAKDRDAKSKAKQEATAKERENAIKASFELGQSSTMSALRNINDLAVAAKTLANMGK